MIFLGIVIGLPLGASLGWLLCALLTQAERDEPRILTFADKESLRKWVDEREVAEKPKGRPA